MIQFSSQNLDPIQRGFSIFFNSLKPIRETSVGRFVEKTLRHPFQILEGATWVYFVHDGISKVQSNNKEKTFYEKTHFQPIDTCSNELYLLANSIKLVFWFTRTAVFKTVCAGIAPMVKVASAVADIFYVLVYGSWMLDDAAKASEDKSRMDFGKKQFSRCESFYTSKSIMSVGSFSSNYCYAMYSGFAVMSFFFGAPAFALISGVCLVGFLGFSILSTFGEISLNASHLEKENEVSSLPNKISQESLSI